MFFFCQPAATGPFVTIPMRMSWQVLLTAAIALARLAIASVGPSGSGLPAAGDGGRLRAPGAPVCARACLCAGAGARLALRGGADAAGRDGAAEASDGESSAGSASQPGGGNAAQGGSEEQMHTQGSEEQMETASDAEDSSAILERGARGSMGAGLSDMETLRSLEHAVRESTGMQQAREQGTGANEPGGKGAEALMRMLTGGSSGPLDPEAIDRLRQGTRGRGHGARSACCVPWRLAACRLPREEGTSLGEGHGGLLPKLMRHVLGVARVGRS